MVSIAILYNFKYAYDYFFVMFSIFVILLKKKLDFHLFITIAEIYEALKLYLLKLCLSELL